MSVITPNTDFILLKSPIELDNRNQLTFANATQQYNYFYNLNKIEAENFTYQRQDETVRFPANIDDIITYNYCMYRNTSYGNKWFYAYITDMKYISNEVTAISIKTDVYQTWQFNLTFKPSFIEREHVNNDTVGLHTIPEGLEMGDYISCKLQPTMSESLETCFVVAATETPTGLSSYSTFNQLLPVGFYYYGLTTLQGVKDLIEIYDEAGQGEAVNSVFVIPKAFFTSWNTLSGVDGSISNSIRFDYTSSLTVEKVNYLGNDYIPTNKKLLTYPYSYLQVSNHSGQVVNYRWENFNLLNVGTEGINFSLKGALTPGGSFKLFPLNYNNILNNNDDTINLGKYPIGAFNNDVYTNWLTQNGINICGIKLNAEQAGYAVGGIQLGVGAIELATGNMYGAGQVATGIGSILGTMQESYHHSMIPDTVEGNLNTGDVNFTFGLTNLEFKRMSIKNEYAMILDKFFSMYGYKINDVKLPNITGRTNWNYVKTIGANIEGYLPQKDLQEIKDIFNSGVTLWHNPSTFLDYSQSNSIV